MTAPNVTTLFRLAARRHAHDMAQLRVFLRSEAGRAFARDIPVFRPADWPANDRNNCYNFALHQPTRNFLQPGQLSGMRTPFADHPKEYSRLLHDCATRDGLVWLGNSFRNCAAHGVPVALFIGKPLWRGPHWFALRRTDDDTPPEFSLIWAHKNGNTASQAVDEAHETIFDAADRDLYRYFAGYYAAPPHLFLRP